MHIYPGISAPAFQVQDLAGNPIRLEDYIGKWLLLSFFRNSACAICNLRVHKLIERYPSFKEKGLEIVTVFESPVESISQYVGKQDAPFPIIPDPAGALYDLYGVEVSQEKVEETMSRADTPQIIQEAAGYGFNLTREEGSNFYRIPAEFLIGPDGTVRIAHYGRFVTDHLPFEVIEQNLGLVCTNL